MVVVVDERLSRIVERRCAGCRSLPERERRFIEHDVARGEDTACRGLVATVATMIRRVAEEDAGHGAWAELVWRGGGHVGVAQRAEDAELGVVGWNAKE